MGTIAFADGEGCEWYDENRDKRMGRGMGPDASEGGHGDEQDRRESTVDGTENGGGDADSIGLRKIDRCRSESAGVHFSRKWQSGWRSRAKGQDLPCR